MKPAKAISVLALSTALASTQIVPSASAAPGDLNPIFLTEDAGPLAGQPAAAQFLAKAQSRGSARVIVVLDVPMSDQASISAAQAATEAAALDRAQDALIARVLAGTGGTNVKRFDFLPYIAMSVTAAQLELLLADPAVKAVQEDLPAPPALNQSVPLINGDDVWALGFQGTNRIVAILDTGVQKTHSMIGVAKVVSEACYSTTDAGEDSTSVCPAGSNTAPGSGVNCPVPTVDGCDHGTHVASIAAGNRTAAPVLKGVAPLAQLIAVQVFSRFDGVNCSPGPSPCALSYTSDQLLGLQRVFALRNSFGARKIDSVNMSIGGGSASAPCTGDVREAAVRQLRDAGIAVAIASGNDFLDGSISRPACIPGAIPVGSSLKTDDGLNGFSNHSAFVQLLAPGDSIKAAQVGAGFGFKSGTSMATPHVAGAWALMRQIKPEASVSRVLAALNCTGKLLDRQGIHRPRINLLAARTELLAADASESFPFTSTAAGWTPLLRAWSLSAGNLRSTNINIWAVDSHSYCSPAFRVIARMRRTDPSSPGFNSGVMIASQAVKVGPDLFTSGYLFAYNKRPGAGSAVVFRLANYNFADNGGIVRAMCNENHPTTAGVSHNVQVDVVNQLFIYKLDGVEVCRFLDFSFPPAKVLIAAQGPASGTGHHIFVDSVTITPIATTVLR